MNQILVTEKIYVTPELKRKKKMYKMLFVISILLIIALFAAYIYAEYDRNKQAGISGDILSFLNKKNDTTTIGASENALVVKISCARSRGRKRKHKSKFSAKNGNCNIQICCS